MFVIKIRERSKGHLKSYKRTERGLMHKSRKRSNGQQVSFKRSKETLRT